MECWSVDVRRCGPRRVVSVWDYKICVIRIKLIGCVAAYVVRHTHIAQQSALNVEVELDTKQLFFATSCREYFGGASKSVPAVETSLNSINLVIFRHHFVGKIHTGKRFVDMMVPNEPESGGAPGRTGGKLQLERRGASEAASAREKKCDDLLLLTLLLGAKFVEDGGRGTRTIDVP